MVNILIRGLIIYLVLIIGIRLMGKRQIGDLQPPDLIITILLSNVASTPIENRNNSVWDALIAIVLFVFLEITVSRIALHSVKARRLLQGNAILVIHDGRLLQKQLKRLRFTVDDLLSALRLKDVFDITDVQNAYVETNGSLSVQLKAEKQTVTYDKTADEGLSALILCDGKRISGNFSLCGMDEKQLQSILKNESVTASEVFLLTAKSATKYHLIRKEKS